MNKRTLKRFLILTTLLGCVLYSTFTFASPTTNVDQVISNTYQSLVDLQKQHASILENYFYHLVDDSFPAPTAAVLPLYRKQLDLIISQLTPYLSSGSNSSQANNYTVNQRGKLATLAQSAEYLRSINTQTTNLLTSPDASIQYSLFRTIIYTNSLIDQLLAFLK